MDINYSVLMVRLLQKPKQYRLILDENFITEVEAEFFVSFPDSSSEKLKFNSITLRAWDQIGDFLYHFLENDFLVVEGELAIQKLAKNDEYILHLENFYPYLDIYF